MEGRKKEVGVSMIQRSAIAESERSCQELGQENELWKMGN